MEKLFHLRENGTTFRRELLCGVTTFLTMAYILFVNSSLLAETGMPWQGVYVATALVSALCTVIFALMTNLPFGIAPGMGLNTFFAYTLCMTMGYHWREGLAIVFLAGLGHLSIMLSPMRKALVNAFPEYLRVAAGAGLGLFIAYVGIRNAGFLEFNTIAYQAMEPGERAVIDSVSVIPGMVQSPTLMQLLAVIGLLIMIVLTALERKTGDNYAALPIGILATVLIGIPLSVTVVNWKSLASGTSALEEFKQISLSFFGRPGLLSVFADPATAARTLMMVTTLGLIGILDSVGTMIGIGQIHNAKLFNEADMERFAQRGVGSKLDKALISGALSSTIAPLLGSSTSTIYLESVTGIVSGGRTGLSAVLVGVLFLGFAPMAGLFQIIPGEVIAPALIIAGASMLTRMRHIDWKNFEECLPAFVTILLMPLAYSILDGIAAGIVCHVAIQWSIGKRREIPPVLYVISGLYVIIRCCWLLL